MDWDASSSWPEWLTGIGSFVPVTLEQLARENGVLLSDHVTKCTGGTQLLQSGNQCVIKLFGWWVNTASFAMWVLSVMVIWDTH